MLNSVLIIGLEMVVDLLGLLGECKPRGAARGRESKGQTTRAGGGASTLAHCNTHLHPTRKPHANKTQPFHQKKNLRLVYTHP